MADDYLSEDLKKALDAAAALINDPKHNNDDPEGTLVASYDYLANAVLQGAQTETQRRSMLTLLLLTPNGKNAADNSQGVKGGGVKEDFTPYDRWSQPEKDAFPKKNGSPDEQYMMLHLGSWCWYTSTGKKCYS